MKKILILGGGFGGVYTAYYLNKLLSAKNVEVTLVNKTNYFLFTPLIHEVATGNIRINNVVQPIRSIIDFDNFHFCKSTITKIDLVKKQVSLDKGTLKYDYLVIALGSTTNFYGMEGSEFCMTLKSLHDAYNLRNQIIDMFEQASMTHNKKEREKLLAFTVVGGGPTGVELVCEISEFVHDTLHRSYERISSDEVRITLINPKDKVLFGVDEKLRDYAMKKLKKSKVTLEMNSRATAVKEDSIEFEKNGKKKTLKSKTIIWTAGVRPNEVETIGVARERGRIPVDSDLRVKSFKNVFAIGDNAFYKSPIDGSSPPGTAQLAQQQAKVAAQNIVALMNKKETSNFTYQSKGFLASLGKGGAIAHIGPLKFHGFVAWFIWRTVYLSKLVGLENRFRVMVDWTVDLFSKRDTSQV